jgi:hypothetical protein
MVLVASMFGNLAVLYVSAHLVSKMTFTFLWDCFSGNLVVRAADTWSLDIK